MRLIDADKINAEDVFKGSSDFATDVRSGISDLISIQPTVDAEPVRHGHWEVAIGYDPHRSFECSECNKMAYEPTNYCPFCGAKMEVEK